MWTDLKRGEQKVCTNAHVGVSPFGAVSLNKPQSGTAGKCYNSLECTQRPSSDRERELYEVLLKVNSARWCPN